MRSTGASRSVKAWLAITAAYFAREAVGQGVFVDDQHFAGLAHAFQHGFLVPGDDRAQVQDGDPSGEVAGSLQAACHHRPPGDHRQLRALQQPGCFPKRQAEIVAWVRAATFAGIQQGAMFQEDRWVIPAQRRAQQPNRVFRVAGVGDPPAQGVRIDRLAADAVPGVAGLLAEADRDAHDHRRGEVVGRPPAQRAQVVDLFVGRVGILAELDFRHRQQTGRAPCPPSGR